MMVTRGAPLPHGGHAGVTAMVERHRQKIAGQRVEYQDIRTEIARSG